jgi:hypothetical protein
LPSCFRVAELELHLFGGIEAAEFYLDAAPIITAPAKVPVLIFSLETFAIFDLVLNLKSLF